MRCFWGIIYFMEEKHQLLRYFFSFYSDYVALLMRFISYNKLSTNLKKKHVLSSLPMLEFSFYGRLWNTVNTVEKQL